DVVGVRRPVERLDGEAEIVAHDLGWAAIHPRDLGARAAPELREAPQERRQPGDAGLDQNHLQFRVLGEDALADEARDLSLKALALAGVILEVTRRPAKRRHRIAVVRAGMDA